jgi:hypothetical protein
MAFANLYQDFAQAIMAHRLSRPYQQYLAPLPTVEDGVRGMEFIEAATLSNERDNKWIACGPR